MVKNINWYKKSQVDDRSSFKTISLKNINMNIKDLINFHRLEYLYSNLSKRDYINDNIKYLKIQEELYNISEEIIDNMLTVFDGWLGSHTSTGWFNHHVGELIVSKGDMPVVGWYGFDLQDDILNGIAKKIINNEVEEKYITLHDDYVSVQMLCNEILWDCAFSYHKIDIFNNDDLIKKFISILDLDIEELYKDEYGNKFDTIIESDVYQWFKKDYLPENFENFENLQQELSIEDLRPENFNINIDINEVVEHIDSLRILSSSKMLDWWNIFIFENDKENIFLDDLYDDNSENVQDVLSEGKGPFFDVFEQVAKTEGYSQWYNHILKISNKDLDKIMSNIEKSRNALKSVVGSTNYSEKSVAITLALNTVHASGSMAEYLGLTNEELEQLSNLNVMKWDKELEKISLRINNMVKNSAKDDIEIEDIETFNDFYKEVYNKDFPSSCPVNATWDTLSSTSKYDLAKYYGFDENNISAVNANHNNGTVLYYDIPKRENLSVFFPYLYEDSDYWNQYQDAAYTLMEKFLIDYAQDYYLNQELKRQRDEKYTQKEEELKQLEIADGLKPDQPDMFGNQSNYYDFEKGSNNWYNILKISQTLDDYLSGNAEELINQQLSYNPKFNELNEEQKEKEFFDLYFKKLIKAIKLELGINIYIDKDNIDIQQLNILLQNKEEIKNNPVIQDTKYFNSVEDLLSLLSNNIEKNLNVEDQNLYELELQNGNKRFIEWVDYVNYDSNKNDVDLTYIRDWINASPGVNLSKVTQEKALILSKNWHDEIQNSNLLNTSQERIRDHGNEAMNGQTVQQIQLNDITLDLLPDNIKDSVNNMDMSVKELNSEFDIKLEGNRMGHCVGGYTNNIKHGDSEIYSLRNDKDESFVTIEVQFNQENENYEVIQIKGKGNKEPVEKYKPFIMQWIIKNNLNVAGDLEGCIINGMFDDALKPFENLNSYLNIMEINLGELTPYNKPFIDPIYNMKILLSQTKNLDFLKQLLYSDNNLGIFKHIATNENIDKEIQEYFLNEKDQSRTVLLRNPVLDPKFQWEIFKSGDYSNLYNLSENPNLVQELKNLPNLWEEDKKIDNNLQNLIFKYYKDDPDTLETLSHNISLIPEIQWKLYSIFKEADFFSIRDLVRNPDLDKELSYKIFDEHKDDVYMLSFLLKNNNLDNELRYEIQKILFEKNKFEFLLEENNLLPEIQYNLLSELSLENLVLLKNNPSLVDEIKQGLNNLYSSDTKIPKNIQNELIKNNDIDVLRWLSVNNIIPEIQDKLLNKRDEIINFNLLSNPNTHPLITKYIKKMYEINKIVSNNWYNLFKKSSSDVSEIDNENEENVPEYELEKEDDNISEDDISEDDNISEDTMIDNPNDPDPTKMSKEEWIAEHEVTLPASEYKYRRFPNVRGGWTKDKIKRSLRNVKSGYGDVKFNKEILKFDSPQELEENLFYHGSGYGIMNLKPSITMRERDVNRFGGGGYGERYWGISLSKDRNIASNFTGQSSSGSVAPVILKKNAKVVSMPEIQDATEIEDHIEKLWDAEVDAVKIGGGEQELVVLNPRSIVVGKPDHFPVYNKPKMPSFDSDKIYDLYENALENYQKAYSESTQRENERFKEKYGRDKQFSGFLVKRYEDFAKRKTRQQLEEEWEKAQNYENNEASNNWYNNLIKTSFSDVNLENEDNKESENLDIKEEQDLLDEAAKSAGYEILYHVGKMSSPSIRSTSESGGVGEVFLTAEPEVWMDSLDRQGENITKWFFPKEKIATESPDIMELNDWAITEGYLERKPLIRPNGEPVLNTDGSPVIAPEETQKGMNLPFYDTRDPMRGGNQDKHLLYAYLKSKGFSAYESEYSPDGHEIAVFDPSEIKSVSQISSSVNQDTPYMEAVKRGDMEEAQRLVDDAAKKNGYTTEAWHVTDSNFTQFDTEKAAMGGIFWFTDDRQQIEAGETGAGLRPGREQTVIHAYLKTQNPAGWAEYDKLGLGQIEEQGFDSINLDDNWVIFSPSQIKSADPVVKDDDGNVIPLSERFNEKSDDIRAQNSKSNIVKKGNWYNLFKKSSFELSDISDQVEHIQDYILEKFGEEYSEEYILSEISTANEYMGEGVDPNSYDVYDVASEIEDEKVRKAFDEIVLKNNNSFKENVVEEPLDLSDDLLKHIMDNTDPAYSLQSTAYILPDGSAVSLGYGKYRRDHRVISDYLINSEGFEENNYGNRTKALKQLMKSGVVRVVPSAPSIQFNTKLTVAQKRTIVNLVEDYFLNNNKAIDIDYPGGYVTVHSVDDLYSGPLYKHFYYASNNNWYKIATMIENLPEHILSNPDLSKELESVDTELFDDDYQQDYDDIYDDMEQPGATGVGVYDKDNKISGYLYGYELIAEDNLPDIENLIYEDIICIDSATCSDITSFVKNIYDSATNGKIFYVSNLAIMPSNRYEIKNIVESFANQMQSSKYEYVAFDALADTFNLLTDRNGDIRHSRIEQYGFKTLAYMPSEDGYLFILKIDKNNIKKAQVVQEDLFDSNYNIVDGQNPINSSEDMRHKIYDIIESNIDNKIVKEYPDIDDATVEMQREITIEGFLEAYSLEQQFEFLDESDKIILLENYLPEFIALSIDRINEIKENIDENDLKKIEEIEEIEEILDKFNETISYYDYDDMLEDVETVNQYLNLNIDIEDILFNNENLINDLFIENNTYNIETDASERAYDDYTCQYDDNNYAKYEFRDLLDEDIGEIEHIIEDLKYDGLQFLEEELINQILDYIKKYKYYSLFYEDSFENLINDGYDDQLKQSNIKNDYSEKLFNKIFNINPNNNLKSLFDNEIKDIKINDLYDLYILDFMSIDEISNLLDIYSHFINSNNLYNNLNRKLIFDPRYSNEIEMDLGIFQTLKKLDEKNPYDLYQYDNNKYALGISPEYRF